MRLIATLVTACLLAAGCTAGGSGARPSSASSSTPARTSPSAEQAVIVHYSLAGSGFGSQTDREAVYALEERLRQAIEAHGVGEFDGNEFGGGEAVLYAYGPDAAALFDVMEEPLRAFPARPAYAILRFGSASDPTAVERRIDL